MLRSLWIKMLCVGSTNTSLCPTKSQIEGFVKSGYGASFSSGVANNQLVDYVNVYVSARYVKGVYVINGCYNTKGLDLNYRNDSNGAYGILEYGKHSGIIAGSNTVNVAVGGASIYTVGWLDDIEYEGDFNLRIWASTSTNYTSPGSSPVDYHTVFIGAGEGTDIVPYLSNVSAGASSLIINEYIENHLNGNGSNYYFYIEIGTFA